MTALNVRALVLAKAPVAGRVKIALPPYSPAQAATSAAAALTDTLRAVACSAHARGRSCSTVHRRWCRPLALTSSGNAAGGLDQRIAAAFTWRAWHGQFSSGWTRGFRTPELLDDG